MLLAEHLDKLASFEPAPFPVISLYLNTGADGTGRPNFEAFLKKEFRERLRTFPPSSPERESFERDVERINRYVTNDLKASTNGVAIFACAGMDDFFEAVQLDAPIDEHRLFIQGQPHLYPLSRLNDQYPRYAVLLADTASARIFVVSTATVEAAGEIEGVKTHHVKVGGWSQARYQRHVENYHLQHAKEVVETLDRLVRAEGLKQIIVAGDEVIVPLLREQLPQHLDEMIVDIMRLDIRTPEHEVLEKTLDALREKDAETDEEVVEQLLGAYRANGLAVVGPDDTLEALKIGQVDTLVIAARPEALTDAERVLRLEENEREKAEAAAGADTGDEPLPDHLGDPPPATERLSDRLVTLAHQTSADVRFIENGDLLAGIGGVGATLRYKI